MSKPQPRRKSVGGALRDPPCPVSERPDYTCRPIAAAAALLLASLLTAGCRSDSKWEGVDKTVIEKVAEDAGHPAREPYLNTDRGDLLLFLFLIAGAAGGFVAGYAFRSLFPPRTKDCSRNNCPVTSERQGASRRQCDESGAGG